MDHQEISPLRFRFSILTILLVTAIVGLSLAYFQSQWQLADRNAQLKQMRRDYQLLDVIDKSKIYVRPLKVPADNMWQWRVHLPEGSTYQIKNNYDSIPPKTPKPAARSSLTLSPGTYVITQMFVFDPTLALPQWRFLLAVDNPYVSLQAGGSVSREDVPWLEARGLPSGEYTLPGESNNQPGRKVGMVVDNNLYINLRTATISDIDYEPDEEVPLLLWKVDEPLSPADQEPVDYLPLEVFRLWIEREPQPDGSANLLPCPLIRQKVLGDDLQSMFCWHEELDQ
ncbi:hypothetical protein C5Y96_00110 [Blastopirellula marina]|uniref:Uncharacterized protein n=1 Tax=Blastopirellula marina TaxID=124 RepID=A0A2S8GBH8_9BACT|nr:hypothetical protein C5Y96_00110 [Blastopirellula marina]RCS56364.1 hypothetical protein DTL36_00110 [Bremerella cremea]